MNFKRGPSELGYCSLVWKDLMKEAPTGRVCPVEHGIARDIVSEAERRAKHVQAFRKQLLDHDGVFTLDQALDPESLLDLRYAAESIYLNYFWEYFLDHPICEKKLVNDKNFWNTFYITVQQAIREHEQRFDQMVVGARRDASAKSGQTLIDRIARLLRELSTTPGIESLAFPGSAEINTFGTKLLQALHERYEKEYGLRMTGGEFERFRANPLMEKSLMYWQFNSREGSGAIKDTSGLTVHHKTPTYMARFEPSAFVIDRETATFGFSPAMIERARAYALARRELAGDEPLAQRNCPVVYAQHFHEMWSWLTGLVAYQLYEGPYPTRGRIAPSHVSESFKRKMHRELAQVIYPNLPKI